MAVLVPQPLPQPVLVDVADGLQLALLPLYLHLVRLLYQLNRRELVREHHCLNISVATQRSTIAIADATSASTP